MTKFTLSIFLQISVFSSLLFAQSDSLDLDLRIGIGATIEKEYGVKFDRYSTPSVGVMKVYMPFFYKSKIKVVPEFAYWDYDVEYNDVKYSYALTHYGINLNYVFLYKPTIFYLGPRFAVDHIVLPYYQFEDDYNESRNDFLVRRHEAEIFPLMQKRY